MCIYEYDGTGYFPLDRTCTVKIIAVTVLGLVGGAPGGGDTARRRFIGGGLSGRTNLIPSVLQAASSALPPIPAAAAIAAVQLQTSRVHSQH